jgi:hypothetical protein
MIRGGQAPRANLQAPDKNEFSSNDTVKARTSYRLAELRTILAAMTKEEESELRAQLARLQQEHRDLDAAIEALIGSPGSASGAAAEEAQACAARPHRLH